MTKSMYRLILLFSFLACFTNGYGEDNISIEQLNMLQKKGMLSKEDYDILMAELNGTLKDEQLCNLNVNGVLIDKRFKILTEGNTRYFPLVHFLEDLGFSNFKNTKEKLVFSINDELIVNLDKRTNTLSLPNDNKLSREISKDKDYIIQEKDEYYLREDIFKNIFLKYLSENNSSSTIRMALGFNTPEETAILFRVRQDEIMKELNQNELVYLNKRKFFELGNVRLEAFQNFDKYNNENKYKKDWTADLEYQGAFLYGDLTTRYDFKEKKLGDIEINYEDFYKDHDLKIGGYKAGSDSTVFGFSLNKDKGYYELGRKFIISERVPIGSKVELVYMGYPIEVKDAENGRVTFDNNIIRSDRSYQLKIYSPNGDVETRYINTAANYNQQNKGEVEYNIDFREDYDSKRYRWDAKAYYGVTNELTLGIGNRRTPEKIYGNYKFLDEGRLEFTYTDSIYENKYPFTLKIGNDRTFTSGKNSNNQNFSDRYKYDGLAEIGIKDLRFRTETENYGKFYKEKQKDRYNVQYSGFDNFTFGYEYEEVKFRNNKKESENKYKINYDKALTSRLLLSSEIEISDKNHEKYRADLFYTGFTSFNINWKNSWEQKISNYESELEFYSNNFYGLIDYSFSLRYSEQQKERFVFSFTLDWDNFLKIASRATDKGSRNFRVGIDKIIDLKNIKAPLESIDSSRVKVVAFVDGNANNICDPGEKRVDNVEVQIRNQKVVTDENGEAIFYGVPNDVVLNLRPTIRKPSYSMGNNIIKIKGIATSTIEAYIPVKPMLTLSGNIELDKNLKLSSDDIQNLYNDIIIKVKDIHGKEIEVTMPDETGSFMVSGIFPEKYLLEIKYIGNKFDLPELKESIELAYIDDSTQKLVVNITDKRFSLNKLFEGKNKKRG